ncbi:Phospholipid methyltransferase [Macleaya cordata]|uniref:Phospholipid methyltransferase n=1 Tax=Macleaya cordata TaxID=56857 RepID=A0A200R567_MACCD|nr:Phospholipid methyltransferase [Macleaya cordata]
METNSIFLHSATYPVGFSLRRANRVTLRPYSKHLLLPPLDENFQNPKTLKNPLKCSYTNNISKPLIFISPLTTSKNRTHFKNPFKCSCSSSSTSDSDLQNPLTKILKTLSFTSLKKSFSELTPLDICKWSGIISVAIAATKWTVNLVLNPFFWMYFSWTWLFWPWFLAVGLAIYGLYCLRKHSRGEANIFEQLVIVNSAFTWLTLVPPAHFNGYLEGWPFVFFFVYHYFFFFNVSIRKRLYGDYYLPEHDPKWDLVPPNLYRFLFCAGVMAGHWFAAMEGPELHLIPGGWRNLGIWGLIIVTLFMHYNSSLYLAKYSEKVVVPTSVVQFGPYRFVRHPIYASTMLLLGTYCVALQAPLSLLFIIAVCLIYYDQKAKLEECLMVETFGERYTEYMSKVRYKFIPLLY